VTRTSRSSRSGFSRVRWTAAKSTVFGATRNSPPKDVK